MIYYDKIDFSEGIDVKKTNDLKECDACYHSYFQDKVFKFQTYVCNGCLNLLAMSINLNDIAILNINGIDFPCIINGISKSEAVNLLQNVDLSEKSGTL